MIVSRSKNQAAVNKIIKEFCRTEQINSEIMLRRFMKYFAKEIVPRIQEDDCYFIDFLDDIERME